MTNPTNKYVTPVGLQQPAAADLSDGTTGSGAVVLAGSPTLTGAPTAPTAAVATNTTQLATTAFVLANAASVDTLQVNGSVVVTPFSQDVLVNGISPVGETQVKGQLVVTNQFNPYRRDIRIAVDGINTTFNSWGEVAPTEVAGAGFINAQNSSHPYGPSIQINTATLNDKIGFISTTANYTSGKNISFLFIGTPNGLVAERLWIGLTSQIGSSGLTAMLTSDNPAGTCAAFRFSNLSAGDTSWQCITKDGTTQTIVASGVLPPAAVMTTFGVICNDSAPTRSVSFYINGALVGTITTHLPGLGTALGWIAASTSTSTSGGNGMFFSQMRVSVDV